MPRQETCRIYSVHSGKYIKVIITSTFPLLNTHFLLRATVCPYIHPMHFRFLCNLKKKHCWGEPNLYMSSLCKLFQSYKGYIPTLIYSLLPQNDFLPSIGMPFLQYPRSQYEKHLLIFIIFFLKKEFLCMFLKQEDWFAFLRSSIWT